MSGGAWEKTAGLVNNGNKNLAIYGQSLLEQVQNGKSSKYVTVYSHDVNVDKDGADIDKAREANWKANTQINGDGIFKVTLFIYIFAPFNPYLLWLKYATAPHSLFFIIWLSVELLLNPYILPFSVNILDILNASFWFI